MHDLFHALSTWDTGPHPPDLTVAVDAHLPRWFRKERIWAVNPILDLTSTDDLPIVPAIRGFVIRTPAISDSSWLALASHLPNLEDLHGVINDKRKQDLAQHRQSRYKLATGLNALNTNNLVHFTLFSRSFGWTRTFRPTSNVLLPDRVDHFSLALNCIMRSPHLNTFRITGDVPISPALFHLPDESTHFPFLEVIELWIAPCAPDGTRYFHGYMPGGGAEEVANYADNDYDDPANTDILGWRLTHFAHQFRWITAAEALRPLVFAAARAVAHHRMPCLDGFQLTVCDLFSPGDGKRIDGLIEYVAPGVSSPFGYGYPPYWTGAYEDPSSVTPRTNIVLPGFEGDLEIAEAWRRVRKGAVVEWKRPEWPN
ncbi:hypothetical protein DIS24_g1206 [Lasiodiplodia hormozganensis]|uniref:Uncharacterized protein n=1 Tax=Lasiodiplodia hormozganensis TaxID=869390 RepID=A0AA39Z3P0_9PEZI|nr:hypothetical protein DIS24_g1206 [Lasiodiplodia hormozganensis]